MNNLPLQPLKWFDCKDGTGADTVTVICEYDVYKYGDERIRYKEEITSGEHSLDSWVVAYYNRHTEAPTKEATGFATIDEAKTWAWNHYNEKMQPYVKPMPTWIDVNERLPEKHTTVLVVYHAHFDDEPITEFDVCTAFFDGETFDPKDQLFYQKRSTTVTHWMLLPKLPSEVTK